MNIGRIASNWVRDHLASWKTGTFFGFRGDSQTLTRIEAFMHQAKTHQKVRTS